MPSGHKEEGTRVRKSVTVRESKSRSKEFRTSMDEASPIADDFKPEDVSEREGGRREWVMEGGREREGG